MVRLGGGLSNRREVYRIWLSHAAAFRDGLFSRTTSFEPSSIRSAHHAFFEVAHKLAGRRARLGSGARLRAEPLTLFLDGWERDVNSTVVGGAVIISTSGKRTHLRA